MIGEVPYAVAAYLALAVFPSRKPPPFIAVVAFGCCPAVELFKLTGIPAGHQRVFLVRWFLGMTFSAVNLAYDLVGVVLIALADGATPGSKRGEKSSRGSEAHDNRAEPGVPAEGRHDRG